jgi:hypothetical protein
MQKNIKTAVKKKAFNLNKFQEINIPHQLRSIKYIKEIEVEVEVQLMEKM